MSQQRLGHRREDFSFEIPGEAHPPEGAQRVGTREGDHPRAVDPDGTVPAPRRDTRAWLVPLDGALPAADHTATQARQPRASAQTYADICRTNAITPAVVQRDAPEVFRQTFGEA